MLPSTSIIFGLRLNNFSLGIVREISPQAQVGFNIRVGFTSRVPISVNLL
jgi:hypothetical protein